MANGFCGFADCEELALWRYRHVTGCLYEGDHYAYRCMDHSSLTTYRPAAQYGWTEDKDWSAPTEAQLAAWRKRHIG